MTGDMLSDKDVGIINHLIGLPINFFKSKTAFDTKPIHVTVKTYCKPGNFGGGKTWRLMAKLGRNGEIYFGEKADLCV